MLGRYRAKRICGFFWGLARRVPKFRYQRNYSFDDWKGVQRSSGTSPLVVSRMAIERKIPYKSIGKSISFITFAFGQSYLLLRLISGKLTSPDRMIGEATFLMIFWSILELLNSLEAQRRITSDQVRVALMIGLSGLFLIVFFTMWFAFPAIGNFEGIQESRP
jgi:hypothetical protein